MVLFFDIEKTNVVWAVHVSKDTLFTPLPLLAPLPITSSIHCCVLPLSDLLATSAASSRSLMPNEKKKSFLLLTLS